MKQASAIACLVLAAGGCTIGPREPSDPPRTRASAAPAPHAEDWIGVRWSPPRPSDIPPTLRALLAPIFAPPGDRAPDEALDDVLARLQLARDATPRAEPPPPIDPARALSAYAEGRSRLFDGDTSGAHAALARAAELDPGVPEIWRELAEAQVVTGARQSAYRSLQRAVDLGMDDPDTLEMLGHFELERGESGEAAMLFASALASADEADNLVLEPILYFNLSRALPAGSRASIEALARAAEAPDDLLLGGGGAYRAEITALFQSRPRLWLELGDDAARHARPADADRFYRLALARSDEPPVVVARLVALSCAAGRHAAASRLLRESIEAGHLRAGDERGVALASLIARSEGRGGSLARELSTLADREGAPASHRAWRLRLLAAGEGPVGSTSADRRALDLLVGSVRLAPWSSDSLLAAAERLEDDSPAEVLGAMARLEEAGLDALELARALVRFLPERTVGAILARPSDEHRHLAAMLALADGQSVHAAELLGGSTRDPRDGAALARVRARASVGDWAGATAASDTIGDPVLRARALSTLQRFQDALDSLATLADEPDASIDTLVEAGGLALGLRDTERARLWLARARAIDPGDSRVYERLVLLHSPRGPLPDADALADAIRSARDLAPDSRFFRRLLAGELVQRGLNDQAWKELERLADEDPSSDEAHDAIIECAPSNPGIEAWARSAAEAHPRLESPAVLLARLLARTSRTTEGERVLRDFLARRPVAARGAARALEAIVAADPAREREARDLALARLDRPDARGPEDSLELATLLAAPGSTPDRSAHVPALLDRAFAPRATPTPDQAEALARVMDALAAHATDPFLDACDRLIERGLVLTGAWHQRRLEFLARDRGADELLAAARAALHQHPALGEAPFQLVADELSRHGRGRLAATFAIDACDPASPPERWGLAHRVAGLVGNADDVRRLVEHARASSSIAALIDATEPPGDDPTERAPITGSTDAEIAYRAGNLAWAAGRAAESLEMYRVALGFDPRHAWACNNLGYFLLESNSRDALPEAEALLEIAYQRLPDESSVLDSLGWLRYAQGRLADSIEPGARRMGAVTLLRIATTLPEGRINPTILDHYADALWAAGEREAAARYWASAEARALQRVEIFSQNPGAEDPRVRERQIAEWTGHAARIRAKIDAHKSGGVPLVPPSPR